MAKRLTDTDKWKKIWYRELGAEYRDIWNYLNDQCDHAGIWEIDFETLRHFTGSKVTAEELKEKFGSRLVFLPDDKLFIRTFFEFQYGGSKKEFKAKISALNELRKLGLFTDSGELTESLPDCSEQLPNSPEHSPECPSKGIGIGIGIGKSKEGESEGIVELQLEFDPPSGNIPEPLKQSPPTRDEWLQLSQAWPHRDGITEGVNRLFDRYKTRGDFDQVANALNGAVRKFAFKKTKIEFIEHFSTWVGTENAERWKDTIDWKPATAPHISAAIKDMPEDGVKYDATVGYVPETDVRPESFEERKAAMDLVRASMSFASHGPVKPSGVA